MVYNTRIAPSPTGDFHLGTARTAYFNYLAARASGGKFILRIDDTDLDRHNESAVKIIYDSLKWLGLDYNISFRQSDRIDFYKSVADILKNDFGVVSVADNGALLLTMPDNMPTSWVDSIAGEIRITDHDLKYVNNLVIIKSNGIPTYHWASVLDDIATNINWVIRGHDHISNTPKHISIYTTLKNCGHSDELNQLLNCNLSKLELPKFSHVGLIYANKKKLSKRDGAASMLAYKDAGYHPDAMLNFLLRLGWGANY